MEGSLVPGNIGVQVISRAAAVLRVIAEGQPAMTITKIASEIDLPRSTVQRLVGALVKEDLLAYGGVRGGYKLGMELPRLAVSGMSRTQLLVHSILKDLSAATMETTHLALMVNKQAIIIDRVIGSARLVASVSIGTVLPVHATASGKALLAETPARQRKQVIPSVLTAVNENTITDHDVLKAVINDVENSGIAYDEEEYSIGVCALGAAFSDSDRCRFAISIPVPSGRFFVKRLELEASLRVAMSRIRRLLGN